MIRVLQVLTIMNRGGAETMVMNYYRHIDRNKVQFDFLLHRQERGDYDDEIEALGGKIFRIPPIFNYFEHKKAVKEFFASHPEYRVIHGHVGELGYEIYKEAKRRAIPCIIAHAHNASSDFNIKSPFRYVLKHLIRKYVTHPMTCGKEAAIWLFGVKIGRQAVMLNNAIDAKAYEYNDKIREAVRREMGWEKQLVIGDVARFSPPKNHIGLLKIFKAVLKEKPNSILVLVGSKGGLYEKVLSEAKSMGIERQIQFLGMRTDVPSLLQGMDVYCSPSIYEGLSVSMVEAQASGLRVVTSTNVPREVELIPNMVDFIPLSDNQSQWVESILKSNERKGTYQDIVEAGFDIYENAKWLQEFYQTEFHRKL